MSIHSDAFDILRDCRALYLKHLRALLQDGGLLSGNAIAAILDGASGYFDEVIASDRRASFADEVDGLTASRITLLAEDDLQLGIRLDNMTTRLFERTGGALWKLHLRFVTLLRRPDLPKSDNPVGPRSICRGLDAMFAAAGVSSLDQKLALLDRIESYLGKNLPALYAELNDYLERAGVDAAQPAIIISPDSPSSAREVPAAASTNALHNLQQMLAASLSETGEATGPLGGGAAANLLSQSALEQLMFRLEAMERTGRFGPPVIPGAATQAEPMMPALFSESAEPATPKIIRSAELGIPKTATESLAIDTLAMIVEAIFDDPELPDALKAAISSLQIKLLKVAMKDGTLFTDTAHPARRVLDRMAEAVLGLPLDAPARHPVCASLFELASGLRTEAGTDPASFTAAAEALDTLIASRQAEVVKAAAAYRALLDQLDQRDLIANQIDAVVERIRAGKAPERIRLFLEQTWRQVLLQIGQENGPASPAWEETVAAIDGLLWTFQPKTDTEERKQLAKRLPIILKALKVGMERIGLPASQQESFLDDCFRLQTQAMRSSSSGTAAEVPATGQIAAPALRQRTGEPVGDKLRAGDLVLATYDFPAHRPPPPKAATYAVGDWLAFRSADATSNIGQVAAICPTSRRVLLLNPERQLAIAVHPAILDNQLRTGEATLRSGQSLFERAAGRALGKSSQG